MDVYNLSNPKSCSVTEQDCPTKPYSSLLGCTGVATLKERASRPVVIEQHESAGFLLTRDLETGSQYRIHKSDFTMGTTHTIPAKYREHNFTSVAHIIGAALKAFPNVIRVNVAPLAPETAARKIREALIAKGTYGYLHALVDEALFAQHALNLSVSIQDYQGKTIIALGSKQALNTPQVTAIVNDFLDTSVKTTNPELVFSSSQTDDLEKLCWLLSNNCLRPRPVITVMHLTPAIIESFEQRYDVGFVPVEGQLGTWHII